MDQSASGVKLIELGVNTCVAIGTLLLAGQAFKSDQTSRLIAKHSEQINKPDFVIDDVRQPEEQTGEMRRDVLVRIVNVGLRPAVVVSLDVDVAGKGDKFQKVEIVSGRLVLPHEQLVVRVSDASKSGIISLFEEERKRIADPQSSPSVQLKDVQALLKVVYRDPKGILPHVDLVTDLQFNPLAYRSKFPKGTHTAWVEKSTDLLKDIES